MERRGRLVQVVDLLGRVVDIRAEELAVALGSFITFALVLGGYYLMLQSARISAQRRMPLSANFGSSLSSPSCSPRCHSSDGSWRVFAAA